VSGSRGGFLAYGETQVKLCGTETGVSRVDHDISHLMMLQYVHGLYSVSMAAEKLLQYIQGALDKNCDAYLDELQESL